ncbi:MAG: hypothetical protein AVDCRST_MAG40-2665, partial [uncultured Gemmatimonadaceae bacterium]
VRVARSPRRRGFSEPAPDTGAPVPGRGRRRRASRLASRSARPVGVVGGGDARGRGGAGLAHLADRLGPGAVRLDGRRGDAGRHGVPGRLGHARPAGRLPDGDPAPPLRPARVEPAALRPPAGRRGHGGALAAGAGGGAPAGGALDARAVPALLCLARLQRHRAGRCVGRAARDRGLRAGAHDHPAALPAARPGRSGGRGLHRDQAHPRPPARGAAGLRHRGRPAVAGRGRARGGDPRRRGGAAGGGGRRLARRARHARQPARGALQLPARRVHAGQRRFGPGLERAAVPSPLAPAGPLRRGGLAGGARRRRGALARRAAAAARGPAHLGRRGRAPGADPGQVLRVPLDPALVPHRGARRHRARRGVRRGRGAGARARGGAARDAGGARPAAPYLLHHARGAVRGRDALRGVVLRTVQRRQSARLPAGAGGRVHAVAARANRGGGDLGERGRYALARRPAHAVPARGLVVGGGRRAGEPVARALPRRVRPVDAGEPTRLLRHRLAARAAAPRRAHRRVPGAGRDPGHRVPARAEDGPAAALPPRPQRHRRPRGGRAM